jgi:DNA-binding beta-propeller fold protein YncE
MLAPEKERPADVRPQTGASSFVRVFIGIALIAVLGIVLSAVSFFGYLSSGRTNPPPPPVATVDVQKEIQKVMSTVGAKAVPPAGDAGGFASIALKFGSEGIGAGSFTDARHIAVDAEGHIYVGDYTGGRVQVFDAAGKFITQWMVDAKMPLRGLAADRRGTVYVVQSGKIRRYEGASGKLLGDVAYNEGNAFDDVVVAADGGLVATFHHHRDDIVRFDATGRAVKVIRAAISSQSDRSELDMSVAVDGLGNIYALGSFNDAVFKFTPDGRFMTRFGSDGDQPGQFRAPHAIAVDNQGRVYVSDSKGIQVFDADGRYLDVFKPVPVAFGLVFNDRNELFVAARTQVVKLTLNKP